MAERSLGKAGEDKDNQVTATPAANVITRAKSETTADKTVPSETTDASKARDVARGATAPGAPGDKDNSADPASASTKAESTQVQKTTPEEVVADSEPNKDTIPTSTSATAPADTTPVPPIPKKDSVSTKDATVTKGDNPASEQGKRAR